MWFQKGKSVEELLRKQVKENVSSKKKECGNCTYWNIGPCRRYPPISIDPFTSRFPITKKEDVCGEWHE